MSSSFRSFAVKSLVLIALTMVALVLPQRAAAQSAGTATLDGRVTDEKGGSIEGAKVTITNTETNASIERKTESGGIYHAMNLKPGKYTITVEAANFTVSKLENVDISVGATLTLDVQLKVAGITATTTVTSEAPTIEPEKMELSQSISQNLIHNLPINGRRWTDFVLLTPGVATDGGFGLVSYRGISSMYNNNTVDGADNDQAFFSEARGRTRAAYAYSLQTIAEFQVTDSNYTAEFGRSAGGIVNAVTKSGTNQFHGDLFWYVRQFQGNALDPFLKSQGNFIKSEKIRHQFGADFGGPLVKDKLFFYGAYDGQRRSFPIGIAPSGTGYFATTATQANCLLSGATANQCTSAIAYLQSLTGSFPRQGNQDIGFGKMDYQINPNNRLSGSINWHDWDSPNGFLTSISTTSAVSNNGSDSVRSRFVVVDLTTLFHANMVNDLRFQYGQDLEFEPANGPGPAVSMTSGITYGENSGLPRTFFPDEKRYQFTDTFSYIRGKHSVKFGVDVNLVHERLANLFGGNGSYGYSGNIAGSPCPVSPVITSSASAFCNWALDVFQINTGASTGKHYTSFSQASDPITGIGLDDFWQNNFGVFIQDSWKVSPKVTINAGLRYDIQLIPQPPRPNTTNNLVGILDTHIPIDNNNWGPRLSIAWQVTPKTVIRAGYGLYYGQTSNSVFYTIRVENGVFQQSFNCGPSTSCAPIFPNVIFTPPGPPVGAAFSGAATTQVINTNPPLATQVLRGLDQNFQNPMVHMGEVVIERDLGWRSSLSVSYVLSRGRFLPVFVDANLAPTAATHTYDIVDSTGATLKSVTLPFYSARNALAGLGTGVILTGRSIVGSWYNGGIVSFKKNFSHGFETIANYTFSKALDNGAVPGTFGTFNGTDTPLDPNNVAGEYALSDLDQRHRFVWSFVYGLPFEHSSNMFKRYSLGGMSFSGIVTFGSGRPVAGFMSGAPGCPSSADFGLTCGEINSNGGFTGGRSPVGRNLFTAPGLQNIDFRVARDFQIHERYKVGIVVEAFNLTNTTHVTSVNSSQFSFTNVSPSSVTCPTALHAASNGCLAPFTGTAPFLSTSATGNNIVGARQLQLSLHVAF